MHLSLSLLPEALLLPWPIPLIIIGVFGAIIGSFLNVVIHRLPRKESIVFPTRAVQGAARRIALVR